MMSRKELDLWVGLFVAIGIAALLFLALKVAGQSSFSASNTYQVDAKFDNIGGLKVRAPVKSSGVVVGRVNGVRFDNQSFQAVVSMTLDGRFQFPRDSSANILTSGLLGEQYVGLAAGGDSENLKNGDTLKITQSAVVLENLISQFLYSKAAEPSSSAPSSGASSIPSPPGTRK
jgi:phospholipid/cholesterol/gamma-HCH transport system substrate-binding protein